MAKYLFTILCLVVFLVAGYSLTKSSDNSSVVSTTEKQNLKTSNGCFFDSDNVKLLAGGKKDPVAIVCEKVKSIDVSIIKFPMDILPEIDTLYKEAYLKILKSEIPTINNDGKIEYFRDLYKMGVEFERLRELSKYYSFYYNDLDGDGLPELGIKSTGYTYILKYEPKIKEFRILFSDATMYYTILGSGQIWFHNEMHVGYRTDRYIVLNKDNEWETVFSLERSAVSQEEIDSGFIPYYSVDIDGYSGIDVGEKNWYEITKSFFAATQNAIPSERLEDVFGNMLVED